MNFFRIKTSWTNAELIPLKICIASAYLLIGAYFSAIVRAYWVPVLVVFGITVVWAVYLWLKKMKSN